MGTAARLSRANAPRQGIHGGFLHSAERYAHRPAVEVRGTILTYDELRSRAMSLAASLQRATPSGGPPLTAVFAYRSATAYSGVLAALLSGHGYVPLNRTFPHDRTRTMLERSGCRSLIVDGASEPQLEAVLQLAKEPLLILLPERADTRSLRSRWSRHTILGASDLEPAGKFEEKPVLPDSMAYLLFTSGSTGIPKGVMVAHRNVAHLVSFMTARYGISEHDRFSQTFDMSSQLIEITIYSSEDQILR